MVGNLKADVSMQQSTVGRFVDEHNSDSGHAGIGKFNEETSALEAELKRKNRFLPLIFSMAALVVFGGVVWYAYNWNRGELSPAALPVISAADTPVKERPADEGGLAIPHLDKAVLNDGLDGGEGQKVEHLLPPPEEPKALEIQAAAVETGPEAGSATSSPVGDIPSVAGESGAAESSSPEELSVAEPAPVVNEPAPVLAPASEPESEPEIVEVEEAPTAIEEQPAAVVREDSGAVEEAAPLETSDGGAEPPKATQQAAKPTENAANLPVDGGFIVQLAALQEPGKIDGEWRRLQKSFPSLLGDMELIVEKADIGGKTFYRLQTGPFPTKATAEDVCAQLRVKKQACILKKSKG
jgi:hypothetical protein